MPYSRYKEDRPIMPPGQPVERVRRQWYNCQKRVKGHYPHPLDYRLEVYNIMSFDGRYRIEGSDPPQYATNVSGDADTEPVPHDWDANMSADMTRATNKAYAKFVDQMKDCAQNANNALEAGQSLGQIMSHVRAIASSIHHVKNGNLGAAAKALGVKLDGNTEKKIKKRAKQAADRWLELHFGWAPLVQDIGSSIDIMQGTGKSSSEYQHFKVGAGFSGNGSSGSFGFEGTQLVKRYTSASWSGGVRMSALVKVDNPNLAIANQMGFVNPLSVAWEAVPFSFVVDWFSNVGQCLSAMTDFWGYQVTEGYTSTRIEKRFTSLYSAYVYFGIGPLNFQRDIGLKHYEQGRSGGLTSPRFEFTPLKSISVSRGATAISLLVQQMGKLK